MSKRLIGLTVLLPLLLFTDGVQAQKLTAAGTLLFEDAINPMPAGPGKVAFFRTDSKIPGDPIEMFVGDVATRETIRALPGHNFRKDAGLVAAWSPDGSQFIIPGKVSGNWELFLYSKGERTGKPITDLVEYRVEVTEQERIQLDIGPSMQLSFAELKYSPSGKRVIFTLSRLAKTSVWWHDLKTGVSRQATEDRRGYNAALHPDDDHFFYTCMVRKGEGVSADEDIVRRSITSGVADTMISTRDHEHYPDVSPDGKYLLYAKRTEGVNNIHVMNLESGETKQLTEARDGQNCNVARWSSDGKMIYVQGAGFLSKPSIFMLKFEPF